MIFHFVARKFVRSERLEAHETVADFEKSSLDDYTSEPTALDLPLPDYAELYFQNLSVIEIRPNSQAI
jgi:hypothetical protein